MFEDLVFNPFFFFNLHNARSLSCMRKLEKKGSRGFVVCLRNANEKVLKKWWHCTHSRQFRYFKITRAFLLTPSNLEWEWCAAKAC